MPISRKSTISDLWYLTDAETATFWGDHPDALLLEAQPGTPRWNELVTLAEPHGMASVCDFWEYPDIAAACAMTGVTREDVAKALDGDVERVQFLEADWSRLTVAGALRLAYELGWPVAALFRNDVDLHRLTALYRRYRVAIGAGRA